MCVFSTRVCLLKPQKFKASIGKWYCFVYSLLLQQVQEKDVELSSLREELSSAIEQVELLTSQLDETRSRADPASVNAQLKLVLKSIN